MFSDKFYYLKLFICLVLIIAASFFSYYFGMKQMVTIKKCLTNPQKYHDKIISIYYGQFIRLENNGFLYSTENDTILIHGRLPDLKNRTHFDLQGTFKSPNYIELIKVDFYNDLKIKYFVSIIALLWIIVLFIRDYRLSYNGKYWYFQQKKKK